MQAGGKRTELHWKHAMRPKHLCHCCVVYFNRRVASHCPITFCFATFTLRLVLGLDSKIDPCEKIPLLFVRCSELVASQLLFFTSNIETVDKYFSLFYMGHYGQLRQAISIISRYQQSRLLSDAGRPGRCDCGGSTPARAIHNN